MTESLSYNNIMWPNWRQLEVSVFIYYVMHVCTYLDQVYSKNQLI